MDFETFRFVAFWLVVIVLAYLCFRWIGWIKKGEDADLDKAWDSVGGFLGGLFDSFQRRLEKKREYTDFNDKYGISSFKITRPFTVTSAAGFKIRYELDLICRRRNDVEFKEARMLEESVRQALAEEYNEALFLPYFRQRNYFFAFGWPGHGADVVRTPVVEIVEQDEELMLREVLKTRLNLELHPIPFPRKGCETQLGYFRRNIFPDELVEENYAMLTEEEIEAVETDDRYGALVEMIAVAALKRRLILSDGKAISGMKPTS